MDNIQLVAESLISKTEHMEVEDRLEMDCTVALIQVKKEKEDDFGENGASFGVPEGEEEQDILPSAAIVMLPSIKEEEDEDDILPPSAMVTLCAIKEEEDEEFIPREDPLGMPDCKEPIKEAPAFVCKEECGDAEGSNDMAVHSQPSADVKSIRTSQESKEDTELQEDGIALHVCNVCLVSSKKSRNFDIHMRTHSEDRAFTCDKCCKSYTQKPQLTSHMLTHTYHILNGHMLTHTYHILNGHMLTHTGERPFQCTLCSKSFSQKAHLIGHMQTHTGERPFRCTNCSKSFSRKSHLIDHMRTHTGERPFQCTLCNKSFSQKTHLIGHMQTHKGEGPFQCTLCSKSFSLKQTLNRHMQTHTEERRFPCTLCSKSFSVQRTLNEHMRTHTGERPFLCTLCSKSFSVKQTLKCHMQTHTE